MFQKKPVLCGEELLAPPNSQLEDYLLSSVSDCLFNVSSATLHTGSRLLHLQPEDTPCRGDRDPPNKAKNV
jgi:hypothetical protein